MGAPNKGKTTLFNAMTSGNAQVANYPFTTIDPNKGVAFVSTKCPHEELGVACKPRHGSCANGMRKIPINVVDVAGLVPGAHEGKGRGNEFLNDLAAADALVCVVDASGSTDEHGMPAKPGYNPSNDYTFIQNELDKWLEKVIAKNALKVRGKSIEDLAQSLSGLGLPSNNIIDCVKKAGLPQSMMSWKVEEASAQLAPLLRKPMAIAANKMDLPNAALNLQKIRDDFPKVKVFPTSADTELALRKAEAKGFVKYDGKNVVMEETAKDSPTIEKAVARLASFVSANGGTGVQELVDHVAFDLLDCIVAYPVEDEKKYADHFGNALPDAILLPKGSTPVDLAAKIHSDLADHFLYAIDARAKRRIGRDEPLANGAVIKIVSSK